jgi:hypothetical protein
MKKSKSTKAPRPPKERRSLFSCDVCLPEESEIGDAVQNPVDIAAWWRNAKLLCRAMRGLNRVMILVYDDQQDNWYWTSVPEEIQ